MKIIETGKHKGETLVNCPESYIVWASQHEKNFSPDNRWVSRDAKAMLTPVAQGNSNWNDWEQALQSEVVAPVEHKPVWNHERCCYVWSDTGELVRDDEKPKYNVVVLSNERKERFDLVGYISRKAEDKRNLVAECREIKTKARSADLGLKGNFGNKGFQLMR